MKSKNFIRISMICFIALGYCCWPGITNAKKVRNSFKVIEEKKDTKLSDNKIKGTKIDLCLPIGSENDSIVSALKGVSFAGYEKEINSNRETFLLVNKSEETLNGFSIKIDYLDLDGRQLHSRILSEPCKVPSGETRKIDFSSWDKQHTYYYHLGNEPRKVATPYKVWITPLAFWIE